VTVADRLTNLSPSHHHLSPIHHCPPPDPADLSTLRRHLRTGPKKLGAFAMTVASTGRRANDVRLMRWQDVRLSEGLWLYRPGRCLPLLPTTCVAIQVLPEVGPWVFPLSWRRTEHPWSHDAAEKSWERFRRSLPGALTHLTLTGLRASREAWIKQEQADNPPYTNVTGLPFHMRQPVPNLAELMERVRQCCTLGGDGITVKDLADLYFQYHLVGKASYDLHRRTFYKELTLWLDRPVSSLRKVEVIEWHASRRIAPSQANRGLGILRAACNWAIRLDLLSCANPTAGIRKFPTRSRERAVEPDEMPKLLWAIETAAPRDRAFFTVCLFTGARSGEVRHMEWQYVNLERRKWVKPTTKNGRSHTVPLPTQVVDVLTVLPRKGRWVFPGMVDEPLNASTPRKPWEAIRRVAGLPDVTIHDLRRTAATWLASNNTNLSVIQHALNHTSLQPTAIYARLHLSSLDKALQGMADQMQYTAGLMEQLPVTSEWPR